MKKIKLSIFRFDPEKDAQPRYLSYQLQLNEVMPLLNALQEIQETQDPSLSYRDYCCSLGPKCGSCLMRVNGRVEYACSYPLKGGEELTVEPVFKYPVIKDLVVDFGIEITSSHGGKWQIMRGAMIKPIDSKDHPGDAGTI